MTEKRIERNYIVKATRHRDGKTITLTKEEWYKIKWKKFKKIYGYYELVDQTEM